MHTHTLRDVLVVMKGTGGVVVNGCGKRGCRVPAKGVVFLGKGNRDEGYQQRVWFLWGWGNRVRLEIQGTVKGCGSSADGVMGRMIWMKVLTKGVVLLAIG